MKIEFTRNDKLRLDPATGQLSMSNGSDVSAYLLRYLSNENKAIPGVKLDEHGLVPVNLLTQHAFQLLEKKYLYYKAMAELVLCA